jgi:hypothetical protein
MYYEEDEYTAEYQIPSQFLAPKRQNADDTPKPQDFADFKAASPISNNGALRAAYAQHVAATYDERQLYKELTAVSDEVMKCLNSILAKIY